jgi:hypothetical protein
MKDINNYLKLKLFIENNLYPKWSWKKLNKGVTTYYDQTFNISKKILVIFILNVYMIIFVYQIILYLKIKKIKKMI